MIRETRLKVIAENVKLHSKDKEPQVDVEKKTQLYL